jgi:hypothetical protein
MGARERSDGGGGFHDRGRVMETKASSDTRASLSAACGMRCVPL